MCARTARSTGKCNVLKDKGKEEQIMIERYCSVSMHRFGYCHGESRISQIKSQQMGIKTAPILRMFYDFVIFF